MADNPISKITDSVSGEQPLEGIRPSAQPPAGFQSLFQGQQQGVPMSGSPLATGTTPMDLARTAGYQAGAPSFDTMIAQSRTIQDGLGTIGDQLKTKDLKLTRSQTQIIKRNLQDAHEHLAGAGQKLGVDVAPLNNVSSSGTLARFLGWVGQGQDTILSVQDKLDEMSKSPGTISATDMMIVQMKMNQGQNEVQFATMLLSKIVDTIKQIMSTQL